MRTWIGVGAALVVLTSSPTISAQTRTLTGKISDSSCGASHDAMTEHGKKGSDKQCTEMCVMKGARYVLVADGKVLNIANQDFKDLKAFAGDSVTVNGDVKADTVTITKMAKAPAR
ncbi:MAG TPA: hypothetical protein VI485_03225 [Vicinamibacterales bacterium]|nr:hypothetical protein [Vicinamibacterales bacterium]